MEAPAQQFPHCDQRILHAPGECEFCDDHGEWQHLRKAWGIAFTGHTPQAEPPWLKEVPCPADFNRPASSGSDHRRWAGNKPTSATGDPAWPSESSASVMMYGDHGGRRAWPFRERIAHQIAAPFRAIGMLRRGWRREDGLWIYRAHRQ